MSVVRNMRRDEASGALLSTDASGLEQYKLARARAIELNSLKEEVSLMRSDFHEIKNLLKALLNDG